MKNTNPIEKPTHFIRHIIEEDLASGKHQKIITRFPPEPNGYLHIGHAKSICLNFGLAQDYPGAQCHLRFDDTNPTKEDMEFVDAIMNDVKWLGFDWGSHLYYASDYFQKLYDFAVELIKKGKAYVCELSADDVRIYRGTLTEPGKESPYRNRSVEENLDLFKKMKNGDLEEGSAMLRAKIDMSSGNINMRDPVIYRIRKVSHQSTGDTWCIYPMYDFAHAISDALEKITHSLCTLEFEDHRPLYDWIVDNVSCGHKPRQIEFSRLELNYTVTSKRRLKQLVDEGHVSGWDDPRLPTLVGMRRRGIPPAALRNFCEMLGVSKKQTIIDMSILEECIREELNIKAPRAFCVLDPLKVVITNYPDDKEEIIQASIHPKDESFGTRPLTFTKTLYIERSDFSETPIAGYYGLTVGSEVRLRFSYTIKCEKVIKDSFGNILEIHCSHDPETLGKKPAGRKVQGIIHWVSEKDSFDVTVHLFDRLFTVSDPANEGKNDDKDFKDFINKNSQHTLTSCKAEKSLRHAKPEDRFQFERLGYFYLDPKSSRDGDLVFNRIVSLRDTWA